jgi:hypothetical protein
MSGRRERNLLEVFEALREVALALPEAWLMESCGAVAPKRLSALLPR